MSADKGPNPGTHNKWKSCVCGGHNASNAKACLHHHATKSRLLVRRARKTRNHP